MILYLAPALFALLVWWFSTGVILFLDRLHPRTFRWSMSGASLLAAIGLWGLRETARDASPRGAYLAFACAVCVWGWHEIGFYMGYLTGPRRALCPPDCRGWARFGHALRASLWREIAILLVGGMVAVATWGGDNQIGLRTFVVLWVMHQSAKLNVFLGVRNLNEDFLPAHLDFLRPFLTQKPMNLLFPVSVTGATVMLVVLVQRAMAAGASDFTRVGETFLSAILALALLEHWLLMLPLPGEKLWAWAAPKTPPHRPVELRAIEPRDVELRHPA